MSAITQDVARKVLATVDAGLVRGVGNPVPGQMCVEAAVCYALGLPHGDDPQCVSRALRRLKIKLNDSRWSSKEARAKGMRRLALVQLGSRDAIDERVFAKRVSELAIRTCVPTALRAAASVQDDTKKQAVLIEAANRCEKEGSRASALAAKEVARGCDAADYAYAAAYAVAAAYADVAAYDVAAYADAAAYAAAYAADAASYAAYADKVLSEFAEGVVQILIQMNAPGVQWLSLT